MGTREMGARMRPRVRGLRLLALAGLVAATACTAQFRNHGYVPPDAALARVEIGDSREELETLIGRPSATALLQEDRWFYVRSRYRDYAWRPPSEVDREVVVVSFAGDAVANIERYGLRNGRVVPLSRRVTDPNVGGTPFLRQIFSNIGNFNPAQFFDEDDQ